MMNGVKLFFINMFISRRFTSVSYPIVTNVSIGLINPSIFMLYIVLHTTVLLLWQVNPSQHLKLCNNILLNWIFSYLSYQCFCLINRICPKTRVLLFQDVLKKFFTSNCPEEGAIIRR